MQPTNQPIPGPQPSLAYSADASGTANTLPRNGLLFPAVSRITGTYTSDEIYNPHARGVRLNLVIAPTGPATGTYNLTVETPSPVVSGTGYVWKPLAGTIGGGTTGDGTGALTGSFLTIYPGLTGLADASGTTGGGAGTTINQHLGPRWRAKVVTTQDTLTFSVGADYLL